ncbi:sodium:solute symporter [Parabacteroides sp. PF5-6]|uniref:sodium:solute symporter n=1 Tax=Parabacteroides sp. PF5-6 TaxID=1742403 RepID=UPI00240636C7|nr:sodium:solute symporter [Parabacteroides sp. PF5-6]MDF9831056.1 Na+/proline symporter [Parabacteroides sp. PF5-6]
MNSSLILVILIAYFAVLLLIAWITGRKSSDNDAFFLGNRQSPWIIVSIGMIGTSLSGVTFVSVPGMVRGIDMTYMQTVLGFFVGYIIIAKVLLPLYYKLQLTSIYIYLDQRIGRRGYKTGASFFLLSKIVGAAARLYLVVLILQTYVFSAWNIPFWVTVLLCIALIWLYTYRSGIKTIIWTDTIQAVCLVAMLLVIIWQVKERMGLDFAGLVETVANSPHARIFEFSDWHSTQHFAKQFFSGIFITIVMTGLDQDMMQKNLSCKSLKDAQKNMYTYGFAFTPVNFLFLSLGVLLVTLAAQQQIELPALNDDILPMFCTSGLLGDSILIFFSIGIIAAAFSSADSALTALTTSFCVDILGVEKEEAQKAKKTRLKVHLMISVLFAVIILIFKMLNNRSVIDAIYMIASYTYGPLLGLFVFGLFTKKKPRDKYVPYICITSPLICFLTDYLVKQYTGYVFSYEMLIFNGLITFTGLWLSSESSPPQPLKPFKPLKPLQK